MRVLLTMSYNNIVLNIIPTLDEGYIVSVHRMDMENRPVDPGSMQGSHRPVSFIRIKHRIRANDILCKTEYLVSIIRAKRVSNCYMQEKKTDRLDVCPDVRIISWF